MRTRFVKRTGWSPVYTLFELFGLTCREVSGPLFSKINSAYSIFRIMVMPKGADPAGKGDPATGVKPPVVVFIA